MMRYFHRGFLIVAMFFVAVTYTGAYFSDSISVSGNMFSSGIWNPGKATISEVFYDPISPPVDTGREWIEIKNTGGYALDMTDYVLHFDGTSSHDFIFPTFSLATGARVVVHVRATGVNSASELYWVDTNGINMSNSYGSVALFKKLPKDETTIVDFVQYGAKDQDSEPKAVAAGIWTDNTFVPIFVQGHSMELIGIDNNLVADWQDQTVPTPGA